MATTSPAGTPNRKELTGPALRSFFRIAAAWELEEAEQMRILGLDVRSTFQSWKRGGTAAISRDALERISYVLGIYKGILLPGRADAWLRNPNRSPLFGGRSALERMTSGNVSDLYGLRQYVDAQCVQA